MPQTRLGRAETNLSISRSRIALQVAVIQTCLRSVHEEAARRTAKLHHERNKIISVHKLAAELHITVLLYAIDPSPVQRLLELSSVATNWWALIKNAPSLWSAIRAVDNGLGMALTRSKNVPLDVVWEVSQKPTRMETSMASYGTLKNVCA